VSICWGFHPRKSMAMLLLTCLLVVLALGLFVRFSSHLAGAIREVRRGHWFLSPSFSTRLGARVPRGGAAPRTNHESSRRLTGRPAANLSARTATAAVPARRLTRWERTSTASSANGPTTASAPPTGRSSGWFTAAWRTATAASPAVNCLELELFKYYVQYASNAVG